MSAEPAGARTPGRKAVLFCPECGHESPPDGDWRVRRAGAARVYACPDCGARVTTRRAGRPTADAGDSWGVLVGRWIGLAVGWATLPAAPSAGGGDPRSGE